MSHRHCISCGALLAVLLVSTAVLAQQEFRSRYGHADMNISCAAVAREPFTRGLLQLHSFAWAESRASFGKAASADPECAMAYWGVAMSHYDSLHEHPDAAAVGAAQNALDRARIARSQTAREKAYVLAAAEIFAGYPDVERVTRDRRYSNALRELMTAYPEDEEAAVFYALSLLALARRGENEQLLTQAADLLEPLFDAHPDHPGIAHYLIHAYDDAGYRAPGLEAARRYAGIAPLMTHAQHMPSHIFAGLGMWEESNASNLAALEADPRYYHALMYVVYGHLQLGQWKEAERLISALHSRANSPQGGRAEKRGLHLTNTWLLLETRDWQAAAGAPAFSDRPLELAETLYVRGLGAAHTGDLQLAADTVESLQSLLESLDTVNDSGLAVRATLTQIQLLEIKAMMALARAEPATAIELLTRAVELEDGPGVSRAPPDSGTGIPAHEMLGETLLDMGQFESAALHFEAALRRTPRRLHSMLGLARAAAGQGDTRGARHHYAEALELLEKADPGHPAVLEAQAYLGADPT